MNARTAIMALPFVLACQSARTDAADSMPDLAALTGESYASIADATPMEIEADGRWWERFGDPLIDVLVEEAVERNLDLHIAAANVREAEARVRAARGARGPALDARMTARRGFNNVEPAGRVYATDLEPSLGVSWQADLFGQLAAAERAQAATLFATEADRDALEQSLIAAVVRQRVEISLAARRIALARDVIESRQSTLRVVEGRYSRGVRSTSAVDVHLARENLAGVESVVAPLERNLAQAYHALDVLLGRKPGATSQDASITAALPTAPAPPVGFPAQLLDRRPDLRASRFRAAATAADVDVRIADLYPDLVLSASGGWSASELGDLFHADTLFGNVLAELATTLFSSGRLEAEVDVARARLEAQSIAYAADILDAVREVEDALVAEQRLREQLAGVERQRDEARRAEDLAHERYRRGLENLLTVLETERRRANADDNLLLLQAEVWNARVDLHLALGGDWRALGDDGPLLRNDPR
ncbi:MAG: efflux transporter outer membrane subunit [bacterium]|nr:efflux transporter outer membrane subunit [bacterium]